MEVRLALRATGIKVLWIRISSDTGTGIYKPDLADIMASTPEVKADGNEDPGSRKEQNTLVVCRIGIVRLVVSPSHDRPTITCKVMLARGRQPLGFHACSQ